MANLPYWNFTIEHFSYLFLFLSLVLTSVGLPIPEEIFLIAAGYAVYLGFGRLWLAIAVALFGILAGDFIGYQVGKKIGEPFLEKISLRLPFFASVIRHARLSFEKWGELAIFFGRFFAGVRWALPILAGSFKMKWQIFFFYDFLGVVIFAPSVIIASFFVGNGLEFLSEIKTVRHVLFLFLAAAIALYILVRLSRLKYRINH